MAPDTIEAALAAPPDHPQFLVTFDDGYTDVAEHALPILTDLGISCVHFLISDAVETGQCKGIPAPRAPFLDRKGIADLTASGHRLGAHSRSHARFDTLDAAELARETDQDTFAYSCDRGAARRLFAYPYGALPRSGLSLAPNTLAFATASVPARAWDKAPQAIRRTFLPSDDIDSWPKLTDHWRRSWNP
ncbi:polysaccharide deacetylase family protein [Phaeobacter sp. BS23]|uniref:polysaccharide deacetylase family protein n=1 Tax=Phaeobacter sp. BS23 TaxID=2907239 RepID=UPI00386DA2B0